MAQRFFGLNRGANHNADDVAVGVATANTDIEVRIDDTKGFTTIEITNFMEALQRRILDGRSNLIGQV
jgi:hypothetical protein